MPAEKNTALRFILKGFTPDHGSRCFTFEGIGSDNVRSPFTVHADLSLARTYGLHIQELPLLCRELLEERAATQRSPHLVLTEADMRKHQADRTAEQNAALQKRRAARRPPTDNTGAAWRTTAPLTIQTRP